MRIRDPIHNFVLLPDEFAPVVDSQALQRLRGIRQLALASLVYPGALHTRFDHTLGVAHVAGLMAESLKLSPEEIRLIRIAALLHDIGHGPFSHVSEYSLAWYADTSTLKEDQRLHKIHEVVTAQIISTDPELGKVLPAEDREAAVKLLGKGHGRPVLRQLVSGPLDADKQDYLLRDSHFCGVQYGVYDLHQLQRSFCLVPTRGGDDELMIDPDGTHAVEQFVLAKYYMTANVYRHRVRLITDQMIGRAIRLGIEVDGLGQMGELYRFDNSDRFIANYRRWDDARFMETFCPAHADPPGPKSGAILRRLRHRNLFKRVFSSKISDLDARVREMVPKLPKKGHDQIRRRVEERVSEHLATQLSSPIDPDFVILHAFDIKSARETSRNEEGEILVRDGVTPRTFTDASMLFQSINEAYADKFVEVYAPVSWPNRDHKDELSESWKLAIRGLIESECLAQRSGVQR